MSRSITSAALLTLAITAAPALAQDAAHARANHGMGFDQATTVHHFLLERAGGTIEVAAKSRGDMKTIDEVRGHLRHIERAFADGDFSLPVFIHATEPPGVQTMKEKRASMTFTYESTPAGGKVVVRTTDAKALAALHEFLRFQIREHKTGDPMEPR